MLKYLVTAMGVLIVAITTAGAALFTALFFLLPNFVRSPGYYTLSGLEQYALPLLVLGVAGICWYFAYEMSRDLYWHIKGM